MHYKAYVPLGGPSRPVLCLHRMRSVTAAAFHFGAHEQQNQNEAEVDIFIRFLYFCPP